MICVIVYKIQTVCLLDLFSGAFSQNILEILLFQWCRRLEGLDKIGPFNFRSPKIDDVHPKINMNKVVDWFLLSSL